MRSKVVNLLALALVLGSVGLGLAQPQRSGKTQGVEEEDAPSDRVLFQGDGLDAYR